MSAYREFSGKSVEEALKAAREEFGVELNDLDFEILTGSSLRRDPRWGARRPSARRPPAHRCRRLRLASRGASAIATAIGSGVRAAMIAASAGTVTAIEAPLASGIATGAPLASGIATGASVTAARVARSAASAIDRPRRRGRRGAARTVRRGAMIAAHGARTVTAARAATTATGPHGTQPTARPT